uniref:Putative secreted protein n=1 Tax=Anopheles triannulatus TaxID=58253 RepID=A0A2M4B1J4_9DIPT
MIMIFLSLPRSLSPAICDKHGNTSKRNRFLAGGGMVMGRTPSSPCSGRVARVMFELLLFFAATTTRSRWWPTRGRHNTPHTHTQTHTHTPSFWSRGAVVSRRMTFF